MHTEPLVLIGWYRNGQLIDTHTLRSGAAEAAIRGKQDYLEVRHATEAYPRLARTLAAQDAALAALFSAAA